MNKIDVTWYHCNDICKGKANTSNFYPIFPKIQFLAIFQQLYLLMGDPLISPLLLLTKLLSLGAVAMISVKRKLLHAITTPFCHHFPENYIFGHFWPFFTICTYSGDCLIPPPLLLTKMLLLGAVALISTERELLQAIPPHFLAICQKMKFLVIFSCFSPFVPALGQPNDLISASIDKNLITGYCCNDI